MTPGSGPCGTRTSGGLAWAGQYLYVADTDGLLVFDFAQLRFIPDGPGVGHYALPQVRRYVQKGSCPPPLVAGGSKLCKLVFSSTSRIANGPPRTLVIAEFREHDDPKKDDPCGIPTKPSRADCGRVVSFPLMSNGLIDTTNRNEQKNQIVTGREQYEFQGVAGTSQTTLLGASFGDTDDPLDGTLYEVTTGPPINPVVATPWPTGTEDLASSQGPMPSGQWRSSQRSAASGVSPGRHTCRKPAR